MKISFRIYRQLLIILMVNISLLSGMSLQAQDVDPTPIPDDTAPQVPDRIDVEPLARNEQIQTRLQDILEATGWFNQPEVNVQDGVVFLIGEAQSEEFKNWASDLARNTQDVAAVVNNLDVIEPGILDFDPIVDSLQDQARTTLRLIPLMLFGLVFLIFASVRLPETRSSRMSDR